MVTALHLVTAPTALGAAPDGSQSRYAVPTMRVLVVDDDVRLCELVQTYLGQHGIETERAHDGLRALDVLSKGAFDAVLLDVMMPGPDGLDVLRRIRERFVVPVLMLTAKGDETDRVVGLELGADDYIAKPFSPRELLARLRAVLRRTNAEAESERLSAGPIQLDLGSRQLRVDGDVVEVTGLEFDLLYALIKRAGRVVPRTRLLAEAGRDDVTVGERTVDVHISHLRRKIGDDPRSPKLIKTVRGVGYIFTREDA